MSATRATDRLSPIWTLALVLYVALIFFLSSRPHAVPPGLDFMLKDKIAHLGEYMVLGMLLFKSIGWAVTRSKFATFMFLLAIGSTLGAMDEVLQSYVPMRRMDIYDWYADVLGIIVGAGLLVLTPLGGSARAVSKQRSNTA